MVEAGDWKSDMLK